MHQLVSGITLLFEHLPSQASKIENFEIFSCPQENQLVRWFFVKFNLLLFFLICWCWKCYMHIQRNISITTVLTAEQTFTTCTKWNFIKPRYVCCEINVFFFNIFINHFRKIHDSDLQGIRPTLKYWPHPSHAPPPPPQKKNILKFKSVPIKNWMLCLHNAQGFPHYTIFICKFKTDECFLFMKRFKFTSWRHLKSVRR